MDNRNQRKYSFIAQVLILFGVDILLLMILALVFGDGARQISNMFQLGSKGLALSTLLQFFLSSVVIISFKTLFFSDKLFKKLLTLWRTILMLFCILLSHILFIIIFHWFPFDNLYAWAGFLLGFGGGFIVCTAFMLIKTRLENRKYNELLTFYKDQHGGEEEHV